MLEGFVVLAPSKDAALSQDRSRPAHVPETGSAPKPHARSAGTRGKCRPAARRPATPQHGITVMNDSCIGPTQPTRPFAGFRRFPRRKIVHNRDSVLRSPPTRGRGAPPDRASKPRRFSAGLFQLAHKFGAVVDIALLVNMAHMGFHRCRRDDELLLDVLRAVPRHPQSEHLLLARR